MDNSVLSCFVLSPLPVYLYLDGNRYLSDSAVFRIILLINIKFTALVFALYIYRGMLLAFALFPENGRHLKGLYGECHLASVFAVGVVGYFPYVINTVNITIFYIRDCPMLKSEAGKFTPPAC